MKKPILKRGEKIMNKKGKVFEVRGQIKNLVLLTNGDWIYREQCKRLDPRGRVIEEDAK